MAIKRVFIYTQVRVETKNEFLAAIKSSYGGASDFFRKRINAKCNFEEPPHEKYKEGTGFIALTVSVSPEQRAALLAQCAKEGKTMGTWMREQILDYLKSKGDEE